jgi:hypothetical protein
MPRIALCRDKQDAVISKKEKRFLKDGQSILMNCWTLNSQSYRIAVIRMRSKKTQSWYQ